MATFYTRQVMPGSVDSAGLSTVTSTLQVDDPVGGQIYNPTTLAGAHPVWFHRLPNGRYLTLFSRRWVNANVAEQEATGPLMYTTYTETTDPSWAVIDPSSGSVTGLQTIPSNTSGARTLVSAVSRGNYLYVLSTWSGSQALLQHFRVGTGPSMILHAEEFVPASLGLGLHIDRNDIVVFGAKDGLLTAVRRNWGRIGQPETGLSSTKWQYRTGRGWSLDPADLDSLPGDIPALAPVSVARWRNRTYLATADYTLPAGVEGDPPSLRLWRAAFYTARDVDSAWTKKTTSGVSLGNGVRYLGGTTWFQPQLALTPGYTTTTTSRGESFLDSHSDAVQAFQGVASHTVVLPATSSRAFTVYNQTFAGTIAVVDSVGQKVAEIRRGRANTLTPVEGGQDWTVSEPTTRTPPRRSGFPYVKTVIDQDSDPPPTRRALLTSWGVFEV